MFKNAGKLSDSDKKSDFSPFKNGSYIFTVKEAVMEETDELTWDNGIGTPTGEKVPQMVVKLSIEKEDGSNEIENVNGVVMVNPTYTVWINESNMGWFKRANKPRPGRAVLAGLLGVAADADISAGLDPEAIVGKKFKAYMTSETNKKGVVKNVLVDVEPIKKK